MEYSTYGRHFVADAWGIDFKLVNDAEFLKELMYTVSISFHPRILKAKKQSLNRLTN